MANERERESQAATKKRNHIIKNYYTHWECCVLKSNEMFSSYTHIPFLLPDYLLAVARIFPSNVFPNYRILLFPSIICNTCYVSCATKNSSLHSFCHIDSFGFNAVAAAAAVYPPAQSTLPYSTLHTNTHRYSSCIVFLAGTNHLSVWGQISPRNRSRSNGYDLLTVSITEGLTLISSSLYVCVCV